MTDPAQAARRGADNAHCPRCGIAFRCGAIAAAADGDPAFTCACAGVDVPGEVLARWRRDYSGCLCAGCLREAAQGLSPAADSAGSAATATR